MNCSTSTELILLKYTYTTLFLFCLSILTPTVQDIETRRVNTVSCDELQRHFVAVTNVWRHRWRGAKSHRSVWRHFRDDESVVGPVARVAASWSYVKVYEVKGDDLEKDTEKAKCVKSKMMIWKKRRKKTERKQNVWRKKWWPEKRQRESEVCEIKSDDLEKDGEKAQYVKSKVMTQKKTERKQSV